jgi:peptide/nickel transport system substrate-binding protein
MKEELALQDVIEGKSDVFMQSVPGNLFFGLDNESREKLDVYSVPSGSLGLFLNPVPNEAPYQWEVEGETFFNPIAIKDVRFAINFLIDRQYIVNEVLNGAGMPKFTQATAGQPNAYRINLLAKKLGFTETGDKEKAIKMITEAMKKASEIKENQGRLKMGSEFWEFDGKPVELKFIIRADDPNTRMVIGNYIADLLEDASLKVERLLYDGNKALSSVYYDDPGKYNWHLYTEGWGAGDTYVYWQTPTMQYYSSNWGFQPGSLNDTWWNFQNPEGDEAAAKAFYGQVLTEEEYWENILKASEIGIRDATRVWIADQNDFFVANAERYKERMPYGLGDGLNRWSLEHSKVEDGVLRVVQHSGRGNLFISNWDPIGADGFSGVYASNISDLVFDRPITYTPFGKAHDARIYLIDTENSVYKDEEGNIKGNLEVPSNAIKYNAYTNQYEEIGMGNKAFTKSTFGYRYGVWHHGREITQDDLIYADVFINEWATKENDQDKEFNNAYSEYWKTDIEESQVGMIFNDDDTITTYFNYNFPPDEMIQAAYWAPWVRVLAASKSNIAVPWELTEALSLMVTEGANSDIKYGFQEDDNIEEIDLIVPKHVEDIRAKLVEMIERKYVPTSLKDRVTVEEAIKNYEKVIEWIDEKGHAVIGNGPYYIENIANDYIELNAFRHEKYPYEKGEWEEVYKSSWMRIDRITMPDYVTTFDDIDVRANISLVDFPSDETSPATKGEVKAILVTPNGEITAEGNMKSEGIFDITIPSEDLEGLTTGTYTVIVTATYSGFTSTETGSILIY